MEVMKTRTDILGTEKKSSDLMTKLSSTKMEPFQESHGRRFCVIGVRVINTSCCNQYNMRKGDFTSKKCQLRSKESKGRI